MYYEFSYTLAKYLLQNIFAAFVQQNYLEQKFPDLR